MLTKSERLLTAQEVADRLQMAVKTVYSERAKGRLPGVPHGSRSWRWQEATVRSYATPAQPVIAAKPVPSDLTALVRAEVAAALERVVAELRGA